MVFARLLRLWDDSPELFDGGDRHNFFWEFKWIAADLADFPKISSEQAEAFLEDMQRRFELEGIGLSTVRMSRFLLSWWTGDPNVEQARLAWVGGVRDEYEDCEACTIGNQTAYFTETGDYARAVELGLTQHSRCNKEPACTHHSTALAALLSGQPELALQQHKLALATTTDENDDNAPARAKCFELLARGGRLDVALRVLRNHDSALLRHSPSPLLTLRFLLGILAGLAANMPEAAELETGLRDPSAKAAEYPLPEDSLAIRVPGTEPASSASVRSEDDAASAAWSGTGGTSAGTAAGGVAPSGAAPSGEELFARAEATFAVRRYFDAAAQYAEAAAAFTREGWIERAGIAYAEAAQSATLGGDDPTSHRCFLAAVPLLQSGGADRSLIVSVLAAWAPVAARLAEEHEIASLLAEMLATHGEPTTEGLSDAPRHIRPCDRLGRPSAPRGRTFAGTGGERGGCRGRGVRAARTHRRRSARLLARWSPAARVR